MDGLDTEIEALRTMLKALDGFDAKTQDRILDYITEKLESDHAKEEAGNERELEDEGSQS